MISPAEPLAFLDTSVVIRYLIGEPPEQAARAAKIIDDSTGLVLSEVVLLEAAYVLSSVYGVPRTAAVQSLTALVLLDQIQVLGLPKAYVVEALALCGTMKRVSFGDALLWAQARASGVGRIFTFDRRFPTQDIELLDGT